MWRKSYKLSELSEMFSGYGLQTPEKRSREVEDGELDFGSDSEVRSGARRRLMNGEATESVSALDGFDGCGALTASASEAASCCSSDGSIQLAIGDPTGKTESSQLGTLTFSGGRCNRSESISEEESGDMESAVASKPLGETNSRFKPPANETEPSKSEIEDFFSSAEKDLLNRFSNKYNFNVEKGVPMKGRYEWVPVKP